MFFKSRITSTPKFGVPNDRLLSFDESNPWVVQGYFTDAILRSGLENTKRYYYDGVFPVTAGLEEFYGTNFPWVKGLKPNPPRVNYVTHKKNNVLSFLLYGRHLETGRTGYGLSEYVYAPCKREPLYSVVAPKALLSRPDLDGAARRAWWQMQPKFGGELATLNALVELKDFKQPALDIAKLMKNLHKDLKLTDSLMPLFRKTDKFLVTAGTPANATRTASEVILTTNLAIRPFLQDVQQLLQQLLTTAFEAEKTFAVNGETPHTTHYSENLANVHTFSNNSIFNAVVEGHSQIAKFTASMERTYSYRPRTAYEAFKSYWGLNVEWDVIWNYIPFSFLVDYFLTISKSIARMQVDKHVDLSTRTYYESLLIESSYGKHVYHPRVRMMFYPDKKSMTCSTVPILVTGMSNSYYERYPASPNFGAALPQRTRSVSDTKWLNMAALARCLV